MSSNKNEKNFLRLMQCSIEFSEGHKMSGRVTCFYDSHAETSFIDISRFLVMQNFPRNLHK